MLFVWACLGSASPARAVEAGEGGRVEGREEWGISLPPSSHTHTPYLSRLSCILNPFWFRMKVNNLYVRDERVAKLKLAAKAQ